jgi:hypothetical protein
MLWDIRIKDSAAAVTAKGPFVSFSLLALREKDTGQRSFSPLNS